MKINKKSILTTGLAVTLAAATLIGGGTYAYLKDDTDPVVNTFNTNKVLVDLTETTGNDYNIIPGTSQTKDPKVTVNATVDSYVYVEVTDATDGLVTYEIADGWTKLEGVANVYYREFTPTGDEKAATYPVLEDDKVTYSAELENSNMLNADGTLKDEVKLTFKAYAVQKTPFDDPVKAYFQTSTVLDVTDGKTVEDINTAIDDATEPVVIAVKGDTTFSKPITVPEGKDVILSLDDNVTLTNDTEHAVTVADGGTLTVKGGTLDATAHAKAAVYNEGGTVVLDNVTLLRSKEAGVSSSDPGGNSYYVLLNHGDMTLNNCTVEADGKYSSLIENGWQNGKQNTSGTDSTLTINGGTYSGGINTVKNDDYGVLEINGGVFKNEAQYAVMNWNVATINGGTFVTTAKFQTICNSYGNDTMDKGQLTITGGYFQSNFTSCISNVNSRGTVQLSGGTYTAKTRIMTNQDRYLAKGYEIRAIDANTWTVVSAPSTGE